MSRPAWMDHLIAQVQDVPAQWFSAVVPPAGGGRRQSAVLLLFGPGADGRTEVLLTERSHSMRSHPGQVSFPGGAHEQGDADLAGTALREAAEEVGLDTDGVDVVSVLPALHIPVSGYDVTPVLAWWREPGPVWVRQPAEVAQVLSVPVDDLLEPAHRHRVRHPSGYVGPAFTVQGVLVWGFTAGLLDKVLLLAGISQEWGADDVRDLPG